MNEAIESAIKIALAQQREEIAKKIEEVRYELGDSEKDRAKWELAQKFYASIVRGMK